MIMAALEESGIWSHVVQSFFVRPTKAQISSRQGEVGAVSENEMAESFVASWGKSLLLVKDVSAARFVRAAAIAQQSTARLAPPAALRMPGGSHL